MKRINTNYQMHLEIDYDALANANNKDPISVKELLINWLAKQNVFHKEGNTFCAGVENSEASLFHAMLALLKHSPKIKPFIKACTWETYDGYTRDEGNMLKYIQRKNYVR